MPPMMVSMAVELGLPLSDLVHAVGAYALAYGLTQPLWGMISDRFGLVATMRFALALGAVFTGLSALTGSALGLALARGLAGGFFGAAIPSTLVYVGDTVPAGSRQRQITHLMTGVAVGTAIASTAAGAMAQFASWRVVFALTAVFALVLVFALGKLPSPPRSRMHLGVLAPLLTVARSRTALLVLVLAFTEGLVLTGTLTLLPPAVEATGTGPAVAGAVTAVYGVAVLVAAQVVGRLSARTHAWRIMALGGGCAVLACALAAFSQAPAVAVAAAALMGVAWAGLHSSLQTWATEVLPRPGPRWCRRSPGRSSWAARRPRRWRRRRPRITASASSSRWGRCWPYRCRWWPRWRGGGGCGRKASPVVDRPVDRCLPHGG